jgi:undecaprenyl-diphosphatase
MPLEKILDNAGVRSKSVGQPSPRSWHRAEILFAATAGFTLVFALLARFEVLFPLGASLDQRVELRVHGWMSGPVLGVLRSVSFFGSTLFIAAGSVAMTVVLAKPGARRRLQAFVASVVGAMLWVQLFKQLFHRARPDLFDPLTRALGFSFPSGHSALAAAFFGSLAGLAAASSRRRREAAAHLAAGVVIVFFVGFSRVALGVHWPTDVLAGWAIGFGWLAFVFATARGGRGGPAKSRRPRLPADGADFCHPSPDI